MSLTDPAAAAREPAGSDAVRPVPAPLLVVLLAVAALGIAVSARPLIADRHARAGIIGAEQGPSLEVYDEFAQASGWLDHEPSYHQRQAAALAAAAGSPSTDPELRRTLLDEALIASGQALDRAPGQVPYLLARAEIELLAAEAAGTTEDADAHLDAAFAVLRGLEDDLRADDALHLPLGRAYEVRARLGPASASGRDRERADGEFTRASRYIPDRVRALEGRARLAVDDDRYADAQRYLRKAQELAPDDPRLAAAIDEVDRRREEQAGG